MMLTLSGCFFRHTDYLDNEGIAYRDDYSRRDCSVNFGDDGKSLSCEIGNLDGNFTLAETDVQNKCNIEFCLSGTIESGKAKFVLVKSDRKSIVVLKEIDSEKNNSYTDNLVVNCDVGVNRIKIVGKNYKGFFKMSQDGENLLDYYDFDTDTQENWSRYFSGD